MNAHRIVEGLVKDRSAWPGGRAALLLLVLDGVGDVRHPDFGMRTPLEAAGTPNLDGLAARSALGRILPVDYGITPGSGPAHLGLFGFDPREVEIGRGVLEAAGLEMDLRSGDVAARANFCTVEGEVVTDRRAGRPATELNAEKCEVLRRELGCIDDVEVIIEPGREHRFALIFRGEGLAEGVTDTDPHENGEPVHQARALRPEARKMARVAQQFQERALQVLRREAPLNGILMRGFSELPDIPSIEQRFGLRSGALATYPMYRGLSRLAGMEVLEAGEAIEDEFRAYVNNRQDYDFMFVHVKGTDMAGEDGEFDRKVSVIEETDAHLPVLLESEPDVIAITGDHSTPCCMKLHSWHPVPLLLHSARCDAGGGERFTEHECAAGTLGTFKAMHLLTLMMSNAELLDKYGA